MNSTVSLVVPANVDRKTALLECAQQDLDIEGDIGTVGRVRKEGSALTIDLKGYIFSGTVCPSNSFLVINVVGNEARVESIINDFIQTELTGNIFDAEAVEEGNIDEFDVKEEPGDEEENEDGENGVKKEEGAAKKAGRKKAGDDDGKAKKKTTKSVISKVASTTKKSTSTKRAGAAKKSTRGRAKK
eukprot:TRINITY_DN6879_c0_g1_i2.p1 TRINITY_DN6879_c0_g1~~TRINITY_DN6879_c0_g1_i2.p1  ORF type:complete len:187 (+),score=64.01 TRINITY_DN6879_c0_g1_i2:62-622(+)